MGRREAAVLTCSNNFLKEQKVNLSLHFDARMLILIYCTGSINRL